MKYRIKTVLSAIVVLTAFAMSSCKTETLQEYSDIEQVALDDWMAEHHPDLIDNRQEEGYYIDLVDAGDQSTRAISDTICWVKYDFTATDLWGNVTITRNDVVAWQQGSFTRNTYYAPYYRLSGEYNVDINEGTYLAFRNPLTIGDKDDVLLYDGAEFEIYMPSSIATFSAGDGGYEGQYTLTSGRPMIANIKVTDVIINPLEHEGEAVDAFAEQNGGLTISAEEDDKTEKGEDDTQTDEEAEAEAEANIVAKEEDPNAWTNANDTIPQLYLNRRFTPAVSKFRYTDTYTSAISESAYFTGMDEIDRKIEEILEERFPDYSLEGERVGYEDDVNVWYIGRFVDGFIFDTNIEEVRKLIFNDDSSSSALTYNAKEDKESYISAWYYTIPTLRYGQWASILSTSSYAYGATGMKGGTSSSSTSSSDYLNYYNYMNSMYGNSYYGGYYDNYYGGYGGYGNGYYGNYGYGYGYDYGYGSNTESETVTTVSTEIPSYTPLIFEIYLEAKDEE